MREHKIDYAFKSKVLNEYPDLVKRQNKASYLDYCKNVLQEDGIVLYGLKSHDYDINMTECDLMTECVNNGLLREYKEAVKINDAFYHRLKRLKQRVETILTSGPSLFLTLTFTDDTLSNTTQQQRRVAVSRYLKQYNSLYVANVDYGKMNHREHYHALIGIDEVKCDQWLKYGSINFERIRLKTNLGSDTSKLSKYINKLTNHAIKETTKRSALMYSR